MDDSIDHLIFATNDLQRGIEQIEDLLGLSANPGGSHQGLGVRNAIIPLGETCYLEILGPDLDQPEFEGSRIFDIDTTTQGRLVHWCVRREGLAAFIQQIRSKGMHLDDPLPMSRLTAQGQRLDWELAFPTAFGERHPVPFFIDWGNSPHPAAEHPHEARLSRFEIRHPDATAINETLKLLSLEPCVTESSSFEFSALISCPRGEVVLS